MSMEQVRAYFAQQGIAHRIMEFEASTATVDLAARAAGDVKVDNGKYKATFGGKAKMLTAQEAVERIGHAVGGVCPFAVKEGVEVYLDQSLRRYDSVLPAAGSANSCIRLTLAEWERYARTDRWVDVCRAPAGAGGVSADAEDTACR